MPDRPPFEPLRDGAFQGILARAFKSFPSRIREVLRAAGWKGFRDFMADVARMGVVLLADKQPRLQTIQERGVEAEIRRLRDEANTDAMLTLLAGAFFPTEWGPDVDSVREALESQDIRTWKEMAFWVLNGAVKLYGHVTGGGVPLDGARPATAALAQIDPVRLDISTLPLVLESFGLASPMHLEALLEAFFSAEITVDDLDAGADDPTRLTAILQAAPSNPHKGLVFGNPGSPSLSGPGRTYAEELVASGIPAISTREEYRAAFRRWGVPNIMLKPGAEMFGKDRSAEATVFVDDFQDGKPMAVWMPGKSGPGPEMRGGFPQNPAAVMYFKDLDWAENTPGNLVAVSRFDWQDAKKAVIDGWRGPGMESEDFAKNRLELFACADMKTDGEGYWRCVRRWKT